MAGIHLHCTGCKTSIPLWDPHTLCQDCRICTTISQGLLDMFAVRWGFINQLPMPDPLPPQHRRPRHRQLGLLMKQGDAPTPPIAVTAGGRGQYESYITPFTWGGVLSFGEVPSPKLPMVILPILPAFTWPSPLLTLYVTRVTSTCLHDSLRRRIQWSPHLYRWYHWLSPDKRLDAGNDAIFPLPCKSINR